MPRYIISYDLRKPHYTESDYQELYTELDNLGAKHIQDSVWAVTTDSPASDIYDALWQHMQQANDRLLVAATIDRNWKNINGITKFGDA